MKTRKAGGYKATDIGVDLMHKAFNKTGALRDQKLIEPEADAQMKLFSGLIGQYKNPTSHRDLGLSNPHTAAAIILFTNHLVELIGIVEESKE